MKTRARGSFTAAIEALQLLGDDVVGAEVVSGVQCNDDAAWRHVWVEHAGKVLDAASGSMLEIPGVVYYPAMRITERVAVPGPEILATLRGLEGMKPREAKRTMLRLMRRLHLPPPARLLSGLRP